MQDDGDAAHTAWTPRNHAAQGKGTVGFSWQVRDHGQGGGFPFHHCKPWTPRPHTSVLPPWLPYHSLYIPCVLCVTWLLPLYFSITKFILVVIIIIHYYCDYSRGVTWAFCVDIFWVTCMDLNKRVLHDKLRAWRKRALQMGPQVEQDTVHGAYRFD